MGVSRADYTSRHGQAGLQRRAALTREPGKARAKDGEVRKARQPVFSALAILPGMPALVLFLFPLHPLDRALRQALKRALQKSRKSETRLGLPAKPDPLRGPRAHPRLNAVQALTGLRPLARKSRLDSGLSRNSPPARFRWTLYGLGGASPSPPPARLHAGLAGGFTPPPSAPTSSPRRLTTRFAGFAA